MVFYQLQAFVDNYGNNHGIPDNWDGRMYGGIYNPLVFSFTIFLFLYGTISMPIAVTTIVIFKFLPIYLKIQWEVAKKLNPIIVIPKFWFPAFVLWFKNGTCENYISILWAWVQVLTSSKCTQGCGSF